MPGPIILNPGQWNECLVRQMTDEERARYGAPVPISAGMKRRRELKKQAEEEDGWTFGSARVSRKMIDERLEANVMNKLGAQGKIDRVRMYELCREHGTSHAATKKIAGELGCSWQTVDMTIKKENFLERLAKDAELAAAPSIETPIAENPHMEHLCMYADSVSDKCAASSGRTYGPERRRKCLLHEDAYNGVERRKLISVIPLGTCAYADTLIPVAQTVEVVPEPEMPIGVLHDGPTPTTPASAMKTVIPSVVCPDDLYIEALDKLADFHVQEKDIRMDVAKKLALKGILGVVPYMNENVGLIVSALDVDDQHTFVMVELALKIIADAAIMGLMLLDSMEAD